MFKIYSKLIDIVISITNTIIVLILDVIRFKSLFISYPNMQGRRVHILGNGPSLKSDFDTLSNNINDGDSIVCVNMFADSDFYQIIKPSIYVMVDNMFFYDTTSEKVDTTINNIIEKTTWPVELYTKRSNRNSRIIERLKPLNSTCKCN